MSKKSSSSQLVPTRNIANERRNEHEKKVLFYGIIYLIKAALFASQKHRLNSVARY